MNLGAPELLIVLLVLLLLFRGQQDAESRPLDGKVDFAVQERSPRDGGIEARAEPPAGDEG